MAEQVDIYADLNTEEDGDALQNEADALYDDVLTGSVDTKTSLENPSNESEVEATPVKISRSGRNVSGPYSVYVGHFSWWTSDRDLIAMAKTLGVKDVLEVKFAEFKVNGQSRGFAKMVVSTEDSLKRLLHSMSQCEIDGEKLECRIASRSHLEMFENQANKRYPQRSDSKAEPDRDEGKSSSVPKKPEITLPLPIPYPPVKPPPVMPSFFGARPPFFNAPPPMFPHPPPHAQFNPHLPKPYLPNTHIPHTHPPNTHTPIPHMHTHPHPHPPSLHINPAFFSSAHATHSSSSTYGQQRDVDSEELINRNRLVASNAINKAMSGATSETIETLLTAIAVIRQSRVYTDERCQTLVESLKDCLYSVESKSCSSRRRHRSRDRARSREKERYRDRSSSTDRERERERERERGRDREHRDRY